MIRAYQSKFASWLAIFAVLVAFFAPTVSQAMSADDHSTVIYQKVCSEHGGKVIPVELPSKHHDGMLGHSGHCAFCCTGNHTPLINSDSAVIVVSSNASQVWTTPAYDSPVVQTTYQVSHPPQAPPAA
jgi:hypothetical protein